MQMVRAAGLATRSTRETCERTLQGRRCQ